MTTDIHLSWSNIIDPYAMPWTASETEFVIPNSDGVTKTVINGSGFDYDPVAGFPTAGTISSIELVLIATETVFQRVTSVDISLADIGAFVGKVNVLREMIDPAWFAVIDQEAADSPVAFSDTEIVYINTDATYTVIQGSGFAVAGGQLSGTVDNVLHIDTDGTTPLGDSIFGLTGATLAEGGAAMFDEVASIQMYLLAGTGANTLERLDTGVTVGDTTFWVDYVDNPGSDTIQGPVPHTHASYGPASGPINANLNLQKVVTTTATGTDTDTFTTTQLIGLMGSQFNDRLTGDGNDNNLNGAQGDDTINGGGGNDLIEGGGGSDSMTGGTGIDTVSYQYALGAVTVSLAQQGTSQDTGGAGTNYLFGFENLTGSQYDDTLTGNVVANSIIGGSGDDTISGGGGNDTLDGGDGGDSMSGGAGIDTVDYSMSAVGVTVDLLNTGSGPGDDWFVSIENVIGTAQGDDIAGSGYANTIDAGDGGDDVLARGGNDTVYGGFGDDTLNGGSGDDEMHGNSGADLLYGSTGNDSLEGGDDNDTINGGDGIDDLMGSAGDDKLLGGGGGDDVVGGAGRDILYGGADVDAFIYTDVTDSTVDAVGRDIIRDFEQGTDVIDLADLGSLTFIDTGPFSGTGAEVRYTQYASVTRVSIDTDGNGSADMSIDITGSFDLTADDFFLGVFPMK